MKRKPKPKKLTAKWLKRHGFTNGLWRLAERARMVREKLQRQNKGS